MSAPQARAYHIVRFSTHDDDLIPAIADFVSDGVRLGERVALVMTRAHWGAVEAALSTRQVRLATALKHRQVTMTDAEEMLASSTVNGRVDLSRVNARSAEILGGLAPPVRMFSELSPLMIAQGEFEAAMELEKSGDAAAEQTGLNILCAYPVDRLKGPAHVDRVCALHHAAVAGGREPRGLKPIVLLADDFPDGRDLYEEYLRHKGYHVVAADDGLQAISLARIAHPALMLLDVRMPRMSGLEAMQILKKEPEFRRTPIVALTAHALDDEREMFLSSGFDAVLAKPCLPADVAKMVERLLN